MFVAFLSCRGRPSEILSSHSLGAVVILCISSIHPRAFIRHRRRHASSPPGVPAQERAKHLYHNKDYLQQNKKEADLRIFISDTNIFIFVAKRDAEGVVPYKEKVNFMGLGKLYHTGKL